MSVVKRFDVNREEVTLNKDFINVNFENNYEMAYSSSTVARNDVPTVHRKAGLQITYLLADGWYIDQYLSSDVSGWENTSNWKVIGPISISQNTLSIGGEEKGVLMDNVTNPEWIQVITDSQDKILYGVKTDGKFYFSDGCPPQVAEYVNNYISDYGYNKSTIDSLLITKVDKVVGKSLIDTNIAENTNYVLNSEWIDVKTDSVGKILEGITIEGKKKILVETEINGIPNKTDIYNFYKNINYQWNTRTIISYKKPGVVVDNINNFDNLMQACYYAYEHASVLNQYDIEVYEDIYATEENEFSLIPHHPSNTREWACLLYTNDFIRIRGIGYPKVISARMNKLTFTTNRTFFNTVFYHGGCLENLKVIAENVKYAVHWESNYEYSRDTTGLIKECEFIHYGGDNELWGNETIQYQSWNAWGCGFSEGCKIQFEKCKLISYTNFAFSTHGNGNTKPVEVNFDSCHLIGGRCGLMIQNPLSGTDKFAVKLTNNFISGGESDIVYSNGTAVNQINVRIYGGNNTFRSFYGTSDKVFLLTPVSNDINCRIIQDDVGIFGNFRETDAEFGIKSYIIGSSGLLGLNTRVGNCSENSKTLSIKFGNNIINVLFNQDYSKTPNADILTFLNNALSGYGTITEDRMVSYYYPEFSDIVVYKKNNGNEVISYGNFVSIDGINVEKLPSSSNADAVCIEQFGVGIGQIGKFRTNL